MAKMYLVQVTDRITREGVGNYTLTGESKVIDGKTYVEIGETLFSVKDGEDWMGSVAEARKAAATKIEKLRDALTSQLARFCEGEAK